MNYESEFAPFLEPNCCVTILKRCASVFKTMTTSELNTAELEKIQLYTVLAAGNGMPGGSLFIGGGGSVTIQGGITGYGTNGGSIVMNPKTGGGVFITLVKSGATQVAAGAQANELWKTSGHATLPDNVIMIGV